MKQAHFRLAAKLSRKSSYYHKLGAVVARKNKILGLGINRPHKSHPKSNNIYRNIHAEFDALNGLTYDDTEGADLYVYRSLKNGTLANSFPCEHCMELIKQAGIKRVYYTDQGTFKVIYV